VTGRGVGFKVEVLKPVLTLVSTANTRRAQVIGSHNREATVLLEFRIAKLQTWIHVTPGVPAAQVFMIKKKKGILKLTGFGSRASNPGGETSKNGGPWAQE
jgi:hypothetical protein